MDRSPSAPDASPPQGRTALQTVLAPRFRGVPILTLGLLAFAAAVLVGNYLPTRSVTAATERALAGQRAENRGLAERIRVAETQAERLEHDPWVNERILRDTLHMSRPGEVLIR